VSECGNVICPHCDCHIVTPPFAFVKPGWGRCCRCHRPFRVTAELARQANVRSTTLLAGVPLRVLKRSA